MARVADDADDVVARLEEPDLLHEALVAELLAVVGGDDDDGVVPLAACAAGAAHTRPSWASTSLIIP